MSQNRISLGTYTLVFVVLMALTSVTVYAAFIDMGWLNTVLALAIAVTKATLVLLYFMHVRYSAPLTRFAIASGVAFFLILVAFTMADVDTRALLGPAAN